MWGGERSESPPARVRCGWPPLAHPEVRATRRARESITAIKIGDGGCDVEIFVGGGNTSRRLNAPSSAYVSNTDCDAAYSWKCEVMGAESMVLGRAEVCEPHPYGFVVVGHR